MKRIYQVGEPLPDDLGACADLLAEVRALRLAMQRETDEMQSRESEIREHLINKLSVSDTTGVAGRRYLAQVVTKVKPVVSSGGWPAFHEYIIKNRRLDLLQKRLTEKPIMELWDDGVTVPGVERFRSKEISLTKLRKR